MCTCRKIIHIDMDAFYASVEQRDRPELRGRPVIVGGDPEGRGVVAACSYEARRFGVHSAMSCARARRLCPQAVFLRPRMERYRAVSRGIMEIFLSCTALVEPLSVDEAFLDVTRNHWEEPSATRIAQVLRARIRARTGLTASAGVAANKFLAKIASGRNKPDGLTVIPPERARAFIAALPVGRFFGVGRVTENKMHALGIRTGADLLRFSPAELTAHFGKAGLFFHAIARGEDHRPVQPFRPRKSISTECTLAEDILAAREVRAVLAELAGKLDPLLGRKQTGGRTLTLKVRYSDFTTITRSCSHPEGFRCAADILPRLAWLLADTEAGQRKIRLLGLAVSNLFDEGQGRMPRQLPLPFPSSSSAFNTTYSGERFIGSDPPRGRGLVACGIQPIVGI